MREVVVGINGEPFTVAIGPGETVTVSAGKNTGSLRIEEWIIMRDDGPLRINHKLFETPSDFAINTRDQKTLFRFTCQTHDPHR